MMNLYFIQHAQHPMYVCADDYSQAVKKWTEFMQDQWEDEEEVPPYSLDPEGVALVCSSDELLV